VYSGQFTATKFQCIEKGHCEAVQHPLALSPSLTTNVVVKENNFLYQKK